MRRGVFICHASEDAARAARVVAVLEDAGVGCWVAPRDIEPGSNYTDAILEGLAGAPAMVLIFSAAANVSPHVRRELETAVGTDTALLPVRIEGVEPSRTLRYFIGTSQWLDALGVPDAQWEAQLVRAAQRLLAAAPGEPVEPETPSPTRPTPPPPTAADPPPAPGPRLPVQRGRTWGREAVCAELTDLLTVEGEALVTLTGLGGIGKTRVAAVVAAGLQRAGRDVHFLDSTALGSPDQLSSAVAALTLRRDALVVLDGLEATPAAGDLVDRLLANPAAPSLLATSRLPLGLPAEREVALPPLDVPRPDDDLETVSASPAVQLFLAAAARSSPDFRAAGRERQVGDLCRLLDGMPLALELAATRLRVHGLERLQASLQGSLDLVSPEQPDSGRQRRSVAEAISWSVGRLDDTARQVLERLSVFEAGFTLLAAEAVCVGLDPIKALTPIIAAGLLRLDDSGEEVRYVLPQLVRVHLRAGWESRPDAIPLREGLARYLLGQLGQWTAQLDTAAGPVTLARFEDHAADVEAGVDAALMDERLDTASALALAACPFWLASGRLSGALDRTRRVLGLVASDHPAVAALHLSAGQLAYHLSEWPLATAELGAASRLAEEQDDQATLAAARAYLGGTLVMTGRLDEGAELARRAFADAERLDLYPVTAVALAMVAISHAIAGDFDEERRTHERRLDVVRRRGDLARTADALNTLAEIALDDEDAAKAHRYASESLGMASEQLPLEQRDALITLARAAAALDRREEAAGSLKAALAASQRTGQSLAVAQCLRVGGVLAASSADPALAVRLFAAAQTLSPSPTGSDQPPERDLAQALGSAREALEAQAASREWTLGGALPLKTVLAQLEVLVGS